MGRTKGHVPIRTCISCGRKDDKKAMIRLVLDERNRVMIDHKGSFPGRGAYVCNRMRCIELLRESKRLNRAFRKEVEPPSLLGTDRGLDSP